MLRKQNGITLIALIITIIVMLILVGVTINVALNGGLFDKATRAKTETQLVADREELQMAVIAALNDNREIQSASAIKNNLQEEWTVTGNAGGPYTCTSPNGNKFTVDEKGKIEEGGIHPGEGNDPVEPEGTVIGGVKAYSVDGTIAIFTPDNKVNLFYTSSSVIPDQTFDVTEKSKEEIETLGISILDFDEEGEDKNLIFLMGEDFVGAVTNDRNKLYMAREDETTGNITISKSVYVQHQDELLAQYYHDSLEYEYFIGNPETAIVCINHTNSEDIKIYMYVDGTYVLMPEEYIKDINIEQNPTDLTINVDDGTVTLTDEAKKISYVYNNRNEVIYYLQDENLYWSGILVGVTPYISNKSYVFERGVNYGFSTKIINTGALLAE